MEKSANIEQSQPRLTTFLFDVVTARNRRNTACACRKKQEIENSVTPSDQPTFQGSTNVCSRSSGFVYERRRPELGTVYQVVRDNLQTLYAAVEDGFATPLPAFVRRELEQYLGSLRALLLIHALRSKYFVHKLSGMSPGESLAIPERKAALNC
jgi:hypothetical protein